MIGRRPVCDSALLGQGLPRHYFLKEQNVTYHRGVSEPQHSRLNDPPMAHISYADVLVVGAGPAGLMMAGCLAHLNVNVRIIDHRLSDEFAGHADGIQPRTIEIWESLGIADALKRVGRQTHRLVTYQANEDSTGIKRSKDTRNISIDTARYPFEIIAHPEDIEKILRDELINHGIYIQQPVVPVNLCVSADRNEDGDYPVEVACTYLDEERLRTHVVPVNARDDCAQKPEYTQRQELVRAKYLVGCDGAHSWVRKQCGISMEGNPAGLTWGVMDFIPDTNFPTTQAKNIIQSPLTGILGFVPRPDGILRLYSVLRPNADPDSNGDSGEDVSSTMSRASSTLGGKIMFTERRPDYRTRVPSVQYESQRNHMVQSIQSYSTRSVFLLLSRARFYSRRRMSHTFSQRRAGSKRIDV